MQKKFILFFSIFLLNLSSNATLIEKFKLQLNSVRRSLFPTESEILNIDLIDERTNPFLKETSKKMIDKKEDGVYLLYNLIYYNFLLNLNKFCLIRYSLKNCNAFHIYANSILTVEIQKEKTQIIDVDIKKENTEETIERINNIESQDFFNIARVYELIFAPTGDESLDQFLNTFKEEFEQPDENYQNDAAALMKMYQDNLESLAEYLNQERLSEKQEANIIFEMEKQKHLERI